MLYAYGVLFLLKEGLVRRTYLLNVLVAVLLVVGLLAPSTAIASSSTTINLWIGNAFMSVNGVKQQIDTQGTIPVIVAGRTLVPIRAIIEAFGGSAAWEASTRKATVMLGKDSLDLWIDKPQASLNGTALAIDSANPAVVPVITNGRTMLPLRFVTESLGIDVQYADATKMITLMLTPQGPPAPTKPEPPTSLVVTADKYLSIMLTWNEPMSSTSKIVSYNVYRTTTPETVGGTSSPWEYDATSPVCFFDDLPTAGMVVNPGDDAFKKIFYYCVTAVNATSLESIPSNVASATPRGLDDYSGAAEELETALGNP